MARWEAFLALCNHLRSGFLPGGVPTVERLTVPWEGLLEIARSHRVITALSWCLRDDPAVPPELHGYIEAVLRLNGKRSARLCDMLARVVETLNSLGIEPILLKGAAHVVGGLYPAPAVRLMDDLDILIASERMLDATAAMKKIGFESDRPTPERHQHRHLPRLRHGEANILVELHTRLMDQRAHPIIRASWLRERSQPVAFRGLRVSIPEPTALIAHNVLHDQLSHTRHVASQVELRQLLDFALIRARHEKQIDWAELDRRFSSSGFGSVLSTYRLYSDELFDQTMAESATVPRARARAIRRLRRSINFPVIAYTARRSHDLANLVRGYIGERRRDPRGLLRLFRARTWVRQYRVVRKILKDPWKG